MFYTFDLDELNINIKIVVTTFLHENTIFVHTL